MLPALDSAARQHGDRLCRDRFRPVPARRPTRKINESCAHALEWQWSACSIPSLSQLDRLEVGRPPSDKEKRPALGKLRNARARLPRTRPANRGSSPRAGKARPHVPISPPSRRRKETNEKAVKVVRPSAGVVSPQQKTSRRVGKARKKISLASTLELSRSTRRTDRVARSSVRRG